MSKVRSTSLLVLCAALAACSDSTSSRTLTAPDLGRDVSEVPADEGVAFTFDGPLMSYAASEEAVAQMAGAHSMAAQLAASSQAASGARSMGHVGLFTTGPATGIAGEKYSYTALQTDPATLGAKGQYEIHYTTVAGVEVKIHGAVSCLVTFVGAPGPFAGNTARVSGPISKVWRNGVQIPITANTHAFWVVVDQGEGAANPDLVSLVRFSNGTIAQNFCQNGFGSQVFPNQEGNIQVRLD